MTGRLSARTVESARSTGLLADGGGLYLQVTRNEQTGSIRKSWIYRYRSGNRTREMGLGPLSAVPLAKAREAAGQARQVRAAGLDPIDHRVQVEHEQRLAVERSKTFKQVAEEFIYGRRSSWRSAKHAAQWPSTLERYAYPVFGDLPVGDITVAHIKKALDPIWTTKLETASRVRSRVEQILNYAGALGLRAGDNPASWPGQLAYCLTPRRNNGGVKHHAALSYADAPKFMKTLRTQRGVAAKALEFTILTAARTGEAIGAKWCEIDFGNAIWTVPADRMKTGRDHRVPLCASVLGLLRELHACRGESEYVFSIVGSKKPISNMAMLTLIKRMGLQDRVTTHGFRSSFRDWAAEQTTTDRAIAEAALSHAPPSKVERAYLRADRIEQRRALMNLWDEFLNSPTTWQV